MSETEKLYKLAIYNAPYDPNYKNNYPLWRTIRLLKSHMERFEKERDEARKNPCCPICKKSGNMVCHNTHVMDKIDLTLESKTE